VKVADIGFVLLAICAVVVVVVVVAVGFGSSV